MIKIYEAGSENNFVAKDTLELQKQIDELEFEIQKLVKQYQNAQKRYRGDSGLSKNIEGKIDALELKQRKLKDLLLSLDK